MCGSKCISHTLYVSDKHSGANPDEAGPAGTPRIVITAVAMNESVAVHMHCFSVWILSAFALFALAELIKEDEPLAGHTQS